MTSANSCLRGYLRDNEDWRWIARKREEKWKEKEQKGGEKKKSIGTARTKNRSCAIEIRWTVWSGFRWTSETPHKVNTHSGYDTLKYTRARLCIYHADFLMGFPVRWRKSVEFFFFLFCFPFCRPFPFSPFFPFFFLLFPISRRSERMIIGFPNGVRDANLFLDFQGTAELSVTVASVQLHRESLY